MTIKFLKLLLFVFLEGLQKYGKIIKTRKNQNRQQTNISFIADGAYLGLQKPHLERVKQN